MQQDTVKQLETEISTDKTSASLGSAGSESLEGHAVNFSPAYLSLLGSALLAACGGSEDGSQANTAKNGAVNSIVDQRKNALGAEINTNSRSEIAENYQPAGAVTTNGNLTAEGFNNYPAASTDAEAARFLLQSQLNASDFEINALRSGSFAAYLQLQFAKPIGQTGWDWLEARGYGVSDVHTYFFNTYPAEFMLWNQLFTAQDSMRKRIALGLSELFVSSMQSAEFNWRSHAYAQYWDILVKNAFGNFRQLLEDITLCPAMGYFLNTKGNLKENITTGRVPDENYGREVMQLFTIGLYKLNLDGTVQTDTNGKGIESYTQSDVTNIARVFTGYDFDTSDGVRITPAGETYTIASRTFTTKPMLFNAANHTVNSSTFLGAATVPANNTNGAALKQTLDILFNHPNVGPFFGKQMIQRFVTSNPSPEYVARVASAFNNNGAGIRGDLKAVWTAIFLDDDARRGSIFTPPISPVVTQPVGSKEMAWMPIPYSTNDAVFGKLREPMLRFIQWGRTFGITSVQNSWKIFSLSNTANQLGQSPLQSPSVFNFFRPGFVPPGTALAATKTTAPEFQIVNETTVGGYLNFMQNVIRAGIFCPEPTVPQGAFTNYVPDVQANYANELALVADPTALVNRLNLLMAAGQISVANKALMVTALSSMPINSTTPATQVNQKMDRVSAAILMVMACSEYLIQK